MTTAPKSGDMTKPEKPADTEILESLGDAVVPREEEREYSRDSLFPEMDQEFTEEERRRAYAAERGIQPGSINYDRVMAGFPEVAPRITGTIDGSVILKAEAAFRRAQTHFLQCRYPRESPEYLYELGQYSLAQGKLLEAHDELLRRLGVL